MPVIGGGNAMSRSSAVAVLSALAIVTPSEVRGDSPADAARVSQLVEANIVGIHAFQVLLARQTKQGDPACFAPGGLSEAQLTGLVDHQTALLGGDHAVVRAWADGRPSTFDPRKDLEPLLRSGLALSEKLPVSVFTAHHPPTAAGRPPAHVRAIANLYQTALEVERDGDRLQHLFAFYIALGLPVYVGQLGLPGTDADLLAAGSELTGKTCAAPVGTSAAEWQIAGRKIWNWGEKNLHVRDAKVLAGELLAEPEVATLLPRIKALPAQKVAVIGHSFTMDLHWSSPSAFVPIVTAMFARENPKVEFRQFQAGGLTSSRAHLRFYRQALEWKPDKVLLVVMNRTAEDLEAFRAMGQGFAAAGATVYTFDDVHDPDSSAAERVRAEVETARAAGMSVIEVGTLLATAPLRDRFVCLDGIHMTEPYHRLMAREWLKTLVAPTATPAGS
jgi:hypothetical protein